MEEIVEDYWYFFLVIWKKKLLIWGGCVVGLVDCLWGWLVGGLWMWWLLVVVVGGFGCECDVVDFDFVGDVVGVVCVDWWEVCVGCG